MTIWMTADLHLGNMNQAERRGFDSVEEHDALIIGNLRGRVRRGDSLWILGDAALGNWRQNMLALQSIEGDVHYLLGNHDRPHPVNRNGHNYLAEFTELGGFASVQTAASLHHNGKHYMLSHFPYTGDTQSNDRFAQWRLPDYGMTIIHGHTHSTERATRSTRGTTQIHVGLDAWMMEPVTLSTAVDLTQYN